MTDGQNDMAYNATGNRGITFEQLPQFVAALNEKMDLLLDLFKKVYGNGGRKDPGHDPHRMMDINEASAFIRKAIPTIYTMTSRGEIPYCKKKHKLYFFEDELRAWIEGGEKPMKTKRDEDREAAFNELQAKIRAGKHRKPKSGFGDNNDIDIYKEVPG